MAQRRSRAPRRIWQSLFDTIPAFFNRRSWRHSLAAATLTHALISSRAVDQISEDSGWHHLGKLYLALAEMRTD